MDCPCACHSGPYYACSIEGGCGLDHHRESPVEYSRDGNIGACAFPGCRDVDGKPTLTQDTICESSRRRYRRILDRILSNYVLIKSVMPAQVITQDGGPVKVSKEYGHPSEWASDICSLIAGNLNATHDDLADHLGHEPPPHPGVREAGRVRAAYAYLTSWFDQLCTYPAAADTAETMVDLDRAIRRGLGQTEPVKFLPVPCPACELLTLTRRLDRAGTDTVQCQNCPYHVPEANYKLFARVILDEILADAEGEAEPGHAEPEPAS